MIRWPKVRCLETGNLKDVLFYDNWTIKIEGEMACGWESATLKNYRLTCHNKPGCIRQAKWPDSQGNKIHEGDKITYRSNSMRHEIYFENGEFFATGGAANSTPIKVTEYLASKSKVRSSKVKYTDAQRAAGMHLFKQDVKPFSGRTKRGG